MGHSCLSRCHGHYFILNRRIAFPRKGRAVRTGTVTVSGSNKLIITLPGKGAGVLAFNRVDVGVGGREEGVV